MTLGPTQQLVLKALDALDNSASTWHIFSKIGQERSESSVRSSLRRLENHGFVRRTWPTGDTSARWELTAEGQKEARKLG